ncbi:MAG: phospholipase D family protein [Desulfomonile tiedjei]|uniref:phospholipase D n=1 Tax=Desulfomonile tiedjei TaxID=2358 RepID=A0A9D6V7N1_9BACT|nr:phospholipase D family protein [Desulfomonile tiedjei]
MTIRALARLVLFVAVICTPAYSADLILDNAPTKVLFSPKGGCAAAIVSEIRSAKSQILVQAYSFTSVPIAKALVDAHKRGVKIEVILDKSQRAEKYTSATFLANSGIPTYIDGHHALAHDKVMILDRAVVITGSFNFTRAAEESNAENIIFLRSEELTELYEANWRRHKGHSEPYEARN